MQDIFLSLISLSLSAACICGTCVDILSGCMKTCSTDGDCSVSTGYYCQKQLCRGKYQLKAELHGRNVSLTWRDFKPLGYQFEYSVAISTSLTTTTMTWKKVEVGSAPECILYDLHPGTIYYATVGIWKDMQFAEYQETSEVILFKTTDAEYCKVGTRRLQVGNIVTNNCEDRCECLSTGALKCEPICKQYEKELQESTGVRCHNETSPDGCCNYIKCSPPPLLMVKNTTPKPILENPGDFANMNILQKSSNWVKLNVSSTPHSSISLVQLCIRQTDKENSTLETDVEGWGQSLYLIDRLQPGQEYEVWLQVVLNNNHSVSTSEIYFNTSSDNASICGNNTDQSKMEITVTASSNSESHLYVGLIVGILSIIAIIFSVQICLILKKKQTCSKRETLFFVNATFGADRLLKDGELHM